MEKNQETSTAGLPEIQEKVCLSKTHKELDEINSDHEDLSNLNQEQLQAGVGLSMHIKIRFTDREIQKWNQNWNGLLKFNFKDFKNNIEILLQSNFIFYNYQEFCFNVKI